MSPPKKRKALPAADDGLAMMQRFLYWCEMADDTTDDEMLVFFARAFDSILQFSGPKKSGGKSRAAVVMKELRLEQGRGRKKKDDENSITKHWRMVFDVGSAIEAERKATGRSLLHCQEAVSEQRRIPAAKVARLYAVYRRLRQPSKFKSKK